MEKVVITALTKKGDGIGFDEKKVPVHIPHTLPGDEVIAELRSKRKGIRKGRMQELLKASPDRIIPPCIHASLCGGCSLQQMAYQKQLSLKQKRVEEAFGKPLEMLYGHPFHYRNKMEFAFSENKAGTKFLGLMIARAQSYVFNLEECHLCSPWFAKTVKSVRTFWEKSSIKAYHHFTDTGSLRTLTLREGKNTEEKMVILTVSGRPEFALSSSEIEEFKKAILEVTNATIILRIHKIEKGKPTEFLETPLFGKGYILEKLSINQREVHFKISPSSFFQPNTSTAELLYSEALKLANVGKEDLVFDLYSGTGTLACIFAPHCKQVQAIELCPDAVLDAKENLLLNKLDNVLLHQGDVAKVLPSLPSPDLILLDPPRGGLEPKVISYILAKAPKKILYISCNPLTQAKDIKELKGYEIKALIAVDQFPHTVHIETIVLLERA